MRGLDYIIVGRMRLKIEKDLALGVGGDFDRGCCVNGGMRIQPPHPAFSYSGNGSVGNLV